jgi:hypothetical protein
MKPRLHLLILKTTLKRATNPVDSILVLRVKWENLPRGEGNTTDLCPLLASGPTDKRRARAPKGRSDPTASIQTQSPSNDQASSRLDVATDPAAFRKPNAFLFSVFFWVGNKRVNAIKSPICNLGYNPFRRGGPLRYRTFSPTPASVETGTPTGNLPNPCLQPQRRGKLGCFSSERRASPVRLCVGVGRVCYTI